MPDLIDIHWPAGGQDRRYGFQAQPPYTTPALLNVRNNDVFEQRLRGGSRPGLVKAFAGSGVQLGMPQDPDEGGGGGDPSIPDTLVTFNPFQAVWMASDRPTTNFNGGASNYQTLRVGFDSTASFLILRFLIHFDLTTLPASITVDSASLSMRSALVTATPPGAGTFFRLTRSDWLEGEATWNSYKTASAWTLAGGDWDAAVSVAVAALATQQEVAWEEFFGFAAIVQDALDNRSGHLHMICKADDEADEKRVHFYSDDYGVQSSRPVLNVRYHRD